MARAGPLGRVAAARFRLGCAHNGGRRKDVRWPAGPATPRSPTPGPALPGRSTPMPVPDPHFMRATLTPPYPEDTTGDLRHQAVLGAERTFWQVDGVYVTAVGYTAGSTPNPTYEEVCSGRTGHTEAVLVVFDPDVVSYEALLRAFWERHDPDPGNGPGRSTWARSTSGVYTTDDQQQAAEASRAAYQRELEASGNSRDHDRDPPGDGLATSPRATTSSTSPRTRAAAPAPAAPACRVQPAWQPATTRSLRLMETLGPPSCSSSWRSSLLVHSSSSPAAEDRPLAGRGRARVPPWVG